MKNKIKHTKRKRSYANYEDNTYRTKKYSNKKLKAFKRKNEAAMKAGKRLLGKADKDLKRYIKVRDLEGNIRYFDRLLGYEIEMK